jgi:GNAT superfamily N-acetyltransferase
MPVVLRTPQEVDLKSVGDLHYRSRAAAYAGFLPPEALAFGSPDALGEWWTERMRWEGGTHRMTIADDGGEVVGFSYLGPSEEPGVAELGAIHVDPARVGTGVGRLLMVDALEHLGPRAVLWVLEQNERARRFYERGGWRADGVTRVAPMGGTDTLQLRYALERKLEGGDA